MRFCLLALASVLGASALVGATRDEELAAQLREQIATLAKAPAESGGLFDFDSQHVAKRLAVLQKELAVVEKRQELEAKERVLRESMNEQPRVQMRERLQAVPPDAGASELRLRELAVRRTQALGERETLGRRMAELRRIPAPAGGASAEAIETEERLITKDEELRAIALRGETVENDADLGRRAAVRRAQPSGIPAALQK